MTYQDYRFLGWESSLDNTIYHAGDSFIVTNNVTLTAKWSTASAYSITYSAGTDQQVNGMPKMYSKSRLVRVYNSFNRA